MTTVDDYLNWCRGQVGFVEGPRGNETPYAKMAGHANFQAWCLTFLVAGANETGLALPEGAKGAYTPTCFNAFKNADRDLDRPEPGAWAFLYFPTMRRIAHVGVVESLRPDGRFQTVEGNTDVAGGRTGGRVMYKVRARSGFSFGMPLYDNAPSLSKPASAPANYRGLSVDGEFGPNTIKALQRALGVSADGVFGPQSKRALQRRLGVAQDGQVGPRTIKALQRHVNSPMDGQWGPNTTRAIQRKLNAGTF